jgi:GNAT superfamily N-acetyltransferase
MGVRVTEITETDTHGLRRKVLRDGRPDAVVEFPQDATPGCFHLGAFDGDDLVGVATFFPEGTDLRPGARGVRLRGMAVDHDTQGKGIGRAILEAAAALLRLEEVDVLWAHGRDSALGFYQRLGWKVEGEGFEENDRPHHMVLLDL